MTAEATFAEFDRAFSDADEHHADDLAAAGADAATLARIDDNWFRHETNWAAAKLAALERTSQAIIAALAAARAANDHVAAARAAADHVTSITAKSTTAADELTGLLKLLG